MGTFILPETEPNAIAFCFHYTGIAPIRALLQDFFRRGLSCPIHLFSSMPATEPDLYSDEFERMGIDVIRFSSNPMKGLWMDESGAQAALKRLGTFLDEHPGAMVYGAGVGPFVRPLRAFAKERGLERKQIRIQRYC